MFTWICPQCGREVPPSYTECPDCKERAKAAREAAPPAPPPQENAPAPYPPQAYPPQTYPPPQQAQPQYPPPPPPQAQPPQQQQYYAPPPQQAGYQPPPNYYPPQAPRRGMNLPVWLMTILFALAIAGVVFGMNWLLSNRNPAGSGPAPAASVESPAAKPGAKANPLQKYIEISAVRFLQEGKKKTTEARFIVTNHSDSEITGLAGNVTVWGRTQKSEEDAQGSFTFNTNLGPYESKEMSVPLNTKRKIYELADWQNITTDVQITAPAN